MHTPGPWEASRMLLPNSATDRRSGFVVNGPDTGDDLPVRICDLRVPAGVDGFAVGSANARLIAAAPELLALVKRLLAILNGDEPDTLDNDLAELAFITDLQHAIEKAEATQ